MYRPFSSSWKCWLNLQYVHFLSISLDGKHPPVFTCSKSTIETPPQEDIFSMLIMKILECCPWRHLSQFYHHLLYALFPNFYGTEVLGPRVLNFDGHLSHVWYDTIKLAEEKNVRKTKLQTHTTNVLQSLNVLCLKSLIDYWGKIISRQINLNCSKLSNSEFLTIISSKDVWNKSFAESNFVNWL